MASNLETTTLEWFGATTFRLRIRGLTIFLDTWLERPDILPKYLSIDQVEEADYIFISHAHFDHLSGADRLAKRTGALVIANSEAINVLAAAGVPEEQLFRVAGGERVPLFTRKVRDQAKERKCLLCPAPPSAPPLPHPSLAAVAAHIWPSLHCLMPGGGAHPDEINTAEVYTGEAHPYVCTMDITRGMKYGLLEIGSILPRSEMDAGMISFVDYIADRKRNLFSHCDGGQLMVNLVADGKALLWNAHLGAYQSIMKSLEPKPEIAILGIAGRANLDGRPWDGSAAQFAQNEVRWLGDPKTVIWCLHDESPIKPYRIKTEAATRMVEDRSSTKVLDMKHAEVYVLDI